MNFMQTRVDGSGDATPKSFYYYSRGFLAVLCLLLPTVFSATMQCEIAHLLRAVIGIVAFVIMLLHSSAGACAMTKKLDIDEGVPTKSEAQCAISGGEGEANANVTKENASRQKEVDLIITKPKEAPMLFDCNIKPKEVYDPTLPASPKPHASQALEDQFSQLLTQLEPTPACRRVVQELSDLLQGSLESTMTGAKVTVFLTGPFWKSTPFVSSVPDIEVSILASSKTLTTFSRRYSPKQGERGPPPQPAKGEGLKWALRVMVKQLLKDGSNYRWRRSSYCLPEAKVTLVASKLGSAEQLVAFDLSLNSGQPVHNALLMAESSKLHPSVQGLLLFVRRWSKVRGLSQACMGYFSTYTWTLLVVYFLQVSPEALLPPAQCSKDAHGRPSVAFDNEVPTTSALGVARLFEAFVRFYSQDFDWFYEEICVTTGYRSTSAYDDDAFPAEENGRPRITDPFRPDDDDLVALVTGTGMARLKEEFHFARTLMESEAPLAMLLQQWIPQNPEESASPTCR